MTFIVDYILEQFYLFKLKNKKEILDYLESKSSPGEGNEQGA
jgi:hypothetical protein